MTNSSIAYLFVALIIGVVLGFLIGRGRQKNSNGSDAQNVEIQVALSAEKARNEQLAIQLSQLTEQLAKEQHENASQLELKKELEALKLQVTAFSTSAVDADRRRAEAEKEIQTRINEMKDNSSELAKSTGTIAKVLSSSQARGRFGEAQLEKLLENAGLIEGEHYQVQRSVSGEGSGRPDVTIAMPGGSVLFIDSKFPFENFYQAYAVEDGPQRDALLKDHAKSLKDHIKKLSDRGYAQQDVSPDFVILFAPIESILADALHVDGQLLDYAFSQRVTIATPTNMLALLRTVGYLFSREKVAQNASQIHRLAEEFLDDITKTYGQINKLGRALKSSVTSYEELVGVVQNTAVRSAKKIRALDVQGPMPEESVEISQVIREIPAMKIESVVEVFEDAAED